MNNVYVTNNIATKFQGQANQWQKYQKPRVQLYNNLNDSFSFLANKNKKMEKQSSNVLHFLECWQYKYFGQQQAVPKMGPML